MKPQLLSAEARRAIAALAPFEPTEEQARQLLAAYARRAELTPDDWRRVVSAFRPDPRRAA